MSLGVTKMAFMKRYVLLFHGYAAATSHRRAAWNAWIERRAASVADVGSPFGPGRRITNDTTDEFSLASNPTTGFAVVVAEHIDAAEQLLEGCPIVDSITLYEVLVPVGSLPRSQPKLKRKPL